jgi:nucleoside-diphosphate-sugar epimerase
MKIAISGSDGFVGKRLVNALETNGYRNIVKIDKNTNIDLTNWSKVKDIKNIDVFFHLASNNFVPDSYSNPILFYSNNFNTTLNALEISRLNNAKFIYISSYVYGQPKYLPIDEKHPVDNFNPYSSSKILCEDLCKSYNKHFGVKVTIIRPFNLYGPDQNNKFLIPMIIDQAKKGHICLNDHRPKRDFLYIDDAIESFIRLLVFETDSIEIFNLGSGISYSIKEIIDTISLLMNKKLTVEYRNIIRENEILETKADIKKISSKLNWEPKVTFKEGLIKTIKYSKL